MEKAEQCIQSEYIRNVDMNELYEMPDKGGDNYGKAKML